MLEWTRRELKLIVSDTHEEDLMQDQINSCILELVEVFVSQGHPEVTGSYVRHILNKVLNYKPLLPLTGEDNEWNEIRLPGENKSTFQNKRCPSVFKDSKGAYDVEAVVFSRDGGESFYLSKDSSRMITFPYLVPDEPEKVILSATSEYNADLNDNNEI